jgi:hypothetical protein
VGLFLHFFGPRLQNVQKPDTFMDMSNNYTMTRCTRCRREVHEVPDGIYDNSGSKYCRPANSDHRITKAEAR